MNNSIKIVVAGGEHDEGIKKVMTRTWLATYPNEKYGISREDILEFWKARKQKKRKPPQGDGIKKWVALEDEKVVGYCIVNKGAKYNEIGAIYILPRYQRKGIGGGFFEKALKYLGEEKDIRIIVVAYNENAIDFYKGFGFKEDGRFVKRRYKLLGEKSMPLVELVKRFKR